MWIKPIDFIEMLIDKFLIIYCCFRIDWLITRPIEMHAIWRGTCTVHAMHTYCDWWIVVRSPALMICIVMGNVSVNWSWNNSIEKPPANTKLLTMICIDPIGTHTNSLKCVLTIECKAEQILFNTHCDLKGGMKVFIFMQRKQCCAHKTQCKIHCIELATSHLVKDFSLPFLRRANSLMSNQHQMFQIAPPQIQLQNSSHSNRSRYQWFINGATCTFKSLIRLSLIVHLLDVKIGIVWRINQLIAMPNAALLLSARRTCVLSIWATFNWINTHMYTIGQCNISNY